MGRFLTELFGGLSVLCGLAACGCAVWFVPVLGISTSAMAFAFGQLIALAGMGVVLLVRVVELLQQRGTEGR